MITVCGEALIDLVSADGREFHAYPSGSPAIVAVALARLGAAASLLTRISTDSFGQLISDHLRRNGVTERDLLRTGEPSPLAVATLDATGAAGAAGYSFYLEGTAADWCPGDLPHRLPDDVQALHSGSLALALDPGARLIEALLAREHQRGAVTITLDPNIRPTLLADHAAAAARFERQLGWADVVKASSADVAWLYPGTRPVEVARRWQRLGPGLVVITDGPGDVLGLTGRHHITLAATTVPVIDTIGAGDTFMAGLLAGLQRGGLLGPGTRAQLHALDRDRLTELLGFAERCAALSCTRPGPDPPSADEVGRHQDGVDGRPTPSIPHQL